MKKLFLFLAMLLSATFAVADASRPYDESANAREQIQSALKSARAGNKMMLVVFGANWCGDCKVLDMEMHQGALQTLVDERLVVVKVDVGRFNRNTDVAEQYSAGLLKKGVPSVVLVKADGTVSYQTTGGELADARKMGRDGLTQFFAAMLERAK